MARVFIEEIAVIGRDPRGMAPMAQEPPLANQTVAIGGSSTQSSAFQATTCLIRVTTDAVCSIEIGTNPTASATTRRLAANQVEYFGIPAGKSFKLAAITNT